MKKLFSKADDFDPGPTQLTVPGPAPSALSPPSPQPALRPKLKEVSGSKTFSTLEEEQTPTPPAPQPTPNKEDVQSQEAAAAGGALTKFKSLLNRERHHTSETLIC